MSSNSNIIKQAFSDVVNIDAWHQETNTTNPTADLHADVVFDEARVGGEEKSQVRFKLSMRRAEIVLVVPETEPVSIDPGTVARHEVNTEIKKKKVTENVKKAMAKGSLSTTVSPEAIKAGASGSLEGERGFTSTETTEMSETVTMMIVTQSKTHEGYYRWSVENTDGKSLKGRPWSPNDSPRVKIRDKRPGGAKSIPPVVRFEVRCRREDLIITEIELKNPSLVDGFISKNKLAAAEAFIKNKLSDEGLLVEEIKDKFSKIVLCSVTAASS